VKADQLKAMIEPAVETLGYELVDVELRVGRGRGLVRLFIDHGDGITLDDCERVSRQVSGVLDVEDPIGGEYDLEVSSPGLDRKLLTPAHFDRFVGEEISVRLRRGIDGRRRFRGRLLGRRGDEIDMQVDGEAHVLPLADVDVARLVPDFSQAASGRRRSGTG